MKCIYARPFVLYCLLIAGAEMTAELLPAAGRTWPVVVGQSNKLGLSPEDQKRVDELKKSADSHYSSAVWAVMVVSVLVAGMLARFGWTTIRSGMQISSGKTITGAPAVIIAVVLFAAAIAVVVGGAINFFKMKLQG